MKLFTFDTRDKKPKLYSLLALTLVIVAVIALLIILDPVGNAGAARIMFAVYCFLSVLILLYAFREQIRYNPYLYNTIIYFGFAGKSSRKTGVDPWRLDCVLCSADAHYLYLTTKMFKYSGVLSLPTVSLYLKL